MSSENRTDRPLTFVRPDLPLGVRLLNWIGNQGRRLGWEQPLSTRKIVDGARRQTRLHDWGESHAAEALDRLVDAFNREAGLTPFGRMFVHNALTTDVVKRLRVRGFVDAHPELHDSTPASPLVIVGMPRTGTTLLQNLLSQAVGARPLLGWEGLNPTPLPSGLFGGDSRRRKARRIERAFSMLAPSLQKIHPFHADGPEECTWLMANTLTCPSFSMFGHIPSYMEWLWGFDDAAWRKVYREYAEQLLVLQHQQAGGHWVLKSPVHAMSPGPLLQAIPSARIVFTQREPREVVPSTCSLFAVFRSIGSKHVDRNALGSEMLAELARAKPRMEAALEEYPERTFQINFRDLVRDKVGTIRRIHEHFDLAYDHDSENRIERWIANDRHVPTHQYRLDQFGISEQDLDRSFRRPGQNA